MVAQSNTVERLRQMETDVQTIRTIASDIILIAVGLLAATLIVIVPTWKRFVRYWNETPKEIWNRSIRLALALSSVPFLYALSGLVSVWLFAGTCVYSWKNLFVILFLLAGALVLPFIVPRLIRDVREDVAWVWAKLRRVEAPARSIQPDISKEFGSIAALMCFQFTVFCLLLVLLGTVVMAVDIDFDGGHIQDNFNSIRVLIVSVPFAFTMGIGSLATSYVAELKQSRGQSK